MNKDIQNKVERLIADLLSYKAAQAGETPARILDCIQKQLDKQQNAIARQIPEDELLEFDTRFGRVVVIRSGDNWIQLFASVFTSEEDDE